MLIKNHIEAQYRKFQNNLDNEYEELYRNFNNEKLITLFSTLHHEIINCFSTMNMRLPTRDEPAHFWAESSRELLLVISSIESLNKALKNTQYAFKIDEEYQQLINN